MLDVTPANVLARRWLLIALTLAIFCEPAHAPAADPGTEAFAPADTPAQYAPDRVIDLEHADLAVFPDLLQREIRGVAHYRGQLLDLEAREITLHAVDFDPAQVEVFVGDELVEERIEGDALIIPLPAPHRGRPELSLTIQWSVKPELGVYFFGPKTMDERREALDEGDPTPPRKGIPERRHALQAWTQGEMHEARHWLPSWDYPNDRFSTSWHVVAPKGLSVIANGEAISHEPISEASLGSRMWALMSASPAIDEQELEVWNFEQRGDHVTYLLSFVVGRFEVVRDEFRGKPVEYWVPPGWKDHARATFGETPEMMEFFSDFIGLEYPWAKYAQTAVQEFTFGGMENVSATTVTDRSLHTEAHEPVADRQGLVAHELAHQWWGDLLTCRDWGHLWLNEGFATYFTALWIEHAQGDDEAALRRSRMASSYFAEARRYRRPIVTRAYRRPSDMFDRHDYPKGGWVLHMLRRELGDAAFQQAIARYARDNAHSLVETEDLQAAIRDATGRELDAFFDQWIYGPGHPELETRWTFDGETGALSVVIEQGQDEVFEFPLELEIVRGTEVVHEQVRIRERSVQIVLPAEAAPDFVVVDPGLHLLAEIEQHQLEGQWIAQLAAAGHGIDRIRAAQALAQLGGSQAALAALRAALADDPFHGVRSAAAASLGSIGSEPAQLALVDAWLAEQGQLSSSDPRIRRAILGGLAHGRAPLGPDELDLILDALEHDPSDHVRAAAAGALIRFDGHTEFGADKKGRKRAAKLHRRTIKVLRKALKAHSFHEEVEQAAARSLGTIGEASQLDELIELTDPIRPTFLRIAAVDGLLRMHRRQGLLDGEQRRRVGESIAAMLDDPNMRIRRAVVDDVAELGLSDARERLQRVIEADLDSRIQTMAEDELRSLN